MKGSVKVDSLSHRYGAVAALEGVSFSIKPGEFFGVLGPNGSGKSTLFKILSTLVRPQTGSVVVGGFDLSTAECARARGELGVVFQFPAVDDQMTVQENLLCHGALHGIAAREVRERLPKLCNVFSLHEKLNVRVGTLSGGFKRRLELAKGLLSSPSILLLDEPTTGLDVSARRETWALLRQLNRQEGISLVITTHLLEEAESSDRVLLLDRGRKIAEGTPQDLKSQVGGDVLSLTVSSEQAACELALEVQKLFALTSQVVENCVRLEVQNGHEFVPRLIGALPGKIQSLAFQKPSLEDAFIKLTGKQYQTEQSPEDLTPRWRRRRKRK